MENINVFTEDCEVQTPRNYAFRGKADILYVGVTLNAESESGVRFIPGLIKGLAVLNLMMSCRLRE